MADGLDRWLNVAENRGEWERLRRALALEAGFALLLVDVPDGESEGRAVELLASEHEQVVILDARSSGAQAPVRELLRRERSLVVVRCVEASRRDTEALERCLIQLNTRRDQIVARGHVLVLVLRRDAVARVLDVAPDLYSVHRARFRFARLVKPWPAPMWLLTDQEFAAVLDDDGRSLEERVVAFEERAVAFEGAGGFDEWARTRSEVEESIAARIFAHYEGLRCLARPRPEDLASALVSPSLGVADILRDSVRAALAAGSPYLAHLSAAALTWMHLQRSDFTEARAALDEARIYGQSRSLAAELRLRHLELRLAAAEGLVTDSGFLEAYSFEMWRLGYPAYISMMLSFVEIQWEVWGINGHRSMLSAALEHLEARDPNRWRFDVTLRSLPSELIGRIIPEQARTEALVWLRERRAARDLNWDATWTIQLMIERALDHAERVAELVDLGQEWLTQPARHRLYEVWHPLVDIHAEAQNTATLEQLIRMPLAPDAAERFGPRLAAALHVVADILERNLIELPNSERYDLQARAAVRDSLSLDMRLGWWAIELALTKPPDISGRR